MGEGQEREETGEKAKGRDGWRRERSRRRKEEKQGGKGKSRPHGYFKTLAPLLCLPVSAAIGRTLTNERPNQRTNKHDGSQYFLAELIAHHSENSRHYNI